MRIPNQSIGQAYTRSTFSTSVGAGVAFSQAMLRAAPSPYLGRSRKLGPMVTDGGRRDIPILDMRPAFSCGSVVCGCSGDDDCNDMFSSGVCGDLAVCIDGNCFCFRW